MLLVILHKACALLDRLTHNFSLQIEQLNKSLNFWLPAILVNLCGIAKVALTVDSVTVSALTIRKVSECSVLTVRPDLQ